jgi:hypothetical protein
MQLRLGRNEHMLEKKNRPSRHICQSLLWDCRVNSMPTAAHAVVVSLIAATLLVSQATRATERPAKGATRYLFATRQFKNSSSLREDFMPPTDMKSTLTGPAGRPARVQLLGDRTPLVFHVSENTVIIELPAAKRSELVDVVHMEMCEPGG